MSLRDLEQIQHDIVEPRTRALFAEIVKCYEGGAHRAALVSLWIAVIADLTAKIRHLAESGDGEAREVVSGLDKALANQSVSKVQEYERTILDVAEQRLSMLLPRERVELERLNEDRNLCAHPGYVDEVELFVPDAEAVRAHLIAAHRAVFSQRPLAGKRLLATLEAEIEGESWPSDAEYFLLRFLRPARNSVKANLTKVLIKHSLRPPDGSNRTARRARNSVAAISREAPALFEESLGAVLQAWETSASLGDSELIRAVGAYGAESVLWSVLPGTGRSRLDALLERCDVETLIDERFFVSGPPRDENLAAKYQQIVSELSVEQVGRAVRQSVQRRPFIDSLLARVESSASFRNAEENLRLIELCSASLELEDVVRLREAIQANARDQVRLAGGTEAILSSIYSAAPPSAEVAVEWRALADWLRRRGIESGDEYYLYEAFTDLVRGEG
ncbi:hypothetical protein [Microbacterium maritypicum]|uniref:Uncharacterized protein n=1 Tax=Microbacterium maritypicum MF109 TaxID=1333857 RepID=T5KK90_MICMQ|nr:hypothetical protein [Microbacterium liquefaciens]EQM78584.1 hypothetical protein L687_16445 [Microbacterium maritypicum MF109]